MPQRVAVSEVSPHASLDTLKELFGLLGPLESIELYQKKGATLSDSRTCFVSFADPSDGDIALHLSNTVFIDRMLVVVEREGDDVPETLEVVDPSKPLLPVTAAPVLPGGLLPTPANSAGLLGSNPPVSATPAVAIAGAAAPGLLPGLAGVALPGLPAVARPVLPTGLPAVTPQLPQTVLPGNIDPNKLEEIRRTVYVGNLNPMVNDDLLIKFFSGCGQIKYVKIAGADDSVSAKHAFVEFVDEPGAARALMLNGQPFLDRAVKVNTSKNPVVKTTQTSREAEAALRRAKEAQALIAASLAGGGDDKKDKNHSRSRSRSRSPRRRSRSPRRRRSRSRSRDRYSRSRRRRSRSRGRSDRDRDRDRDRKRDKDKDRSSRRSRSRSRSPRRKDKKKHKKRDKEDSDDASDKAAAAEE